MKQSAFQFHPDPPRARRTDALSSHRAADGITPHLSKQRREVWEALKAHPGRSTKSLAEVSGLDRHMVGRRMGELEQRGYAKRIKRDSRDCLWFALEGKG